MFEGCLVLLVIWFALVDLFGNSYFAFDLLACCSLRLLVFMCCFLIACLLLSCCLILLDLG